MFKTLFFCSSVSICEMTNSFIFSVRRFKCFRGAFKSDLYAQRDMKLLLNILAIIHSFIFNFFKKLFTFIALDLIALFISIALTPDSASKSTYIHNTSMWFLWTFILIYGIGINFMISKAFSVDRQDYIMIKLFNMNSKKYYINKMAFSWLSNLFYNSIFMLIILLVGHLFTPIFFFKLMLIYLSLMVIGDAIRLKLNDSYGIDIISKSGNKKNKSDHKKTASSPSDISQRKSSNILNTYLTIICFVILFIYVFGVVLCIFSKPTTSNNVYINIINSLFNPSSKKIFYPPIYDFISSWYVVVFLLIFACISLFYLIHYDNYTYIGKHHATLNNAIKSDKINNSGSQTAIADKYISNDNSTSKNFENKKGYEYLNAIFFDRHKTLVSNMSKVELYIFELLFAILYLFIITGYIGLTPFYTYEDVCKFCGILLKYAMFPFTFLMMSSISPGNKITSAMFYNCDISLLQYKFYRKKEVIIKNFFIRLKYMIKCQQRVMLVIFLGLMILAVLMPGHDYLYMLLYALSMCLSCIFFTFVFLCMYYIFQPYTSSGKVIGFAYKLFSAIILFLAYFFINSHLKITILVLCIGLGIMLLFMIAMYIATLKLAPKNFHLN